MPADSIIIIIKDVPERGKPETTNIGFINSFGVLLLKKRFITEKRAGNPARSSGYLAVIAVWLDQVAAIRLTCT
jgi:hypothetical protein